MSRAVHFPSPHEVQRGALPPEVTEQPAFRNYADGFGYKFYGGRHNGGDKLLAAEMQRRGWPLQKQAHFLVSRWGRHAGDALTFARAKATARLAGVLRAFERDYHPSQFSDLEGETDAS